MDADELVAARTLRPETEAQLADAVQTAIVEGRPLELLGGGTKRGWGRPVEAHDRLELGGFAGILAYEPEELVLTCRAGTPLAEIEATLAGHRQHLAFEPPDLRALYGVPESGSGATLGGVLACNLAGPRRIRAGAARDHLLGFSAVSGRGERFKAGGRVVKNVTGFDLSKLVTGSFGTLAALTEVTVRALPASEDERTLRVAGLDDAPAIAAMTAALASAADVSAAAHLPATVSGSFSSLALPDGLSATLLRLEGPAPSVAARAAELQRLLQPFGPVSALAADESRALWRLVRDVACFAARPDSPPERLVWRLSVPPASGAVVTEAIFERLDGEAYYDWGGGLIWLALAPSLDAGEPVVRGAVGMTGGHATLVRADPSLRARVPVFQQQPPALAALARRVKDGFDPGRILNPGRMYADV